MAKAKPAEDKSKITDVAHPGKTPPSETSKPIITNRPVLKDPMVVEDDDADKVAVTIDKPHVGKVLTPDEPTVADQPAATASLADTTKTEEANSAPAEPEKSAKPAAPKKSETPPKDEKSIAETAPKTDDQPATDNDKPASEEETAETAPDDDAQKAPQPAPADLQAEEAKRAEHEAAIQKLADSKQYYLPINSVEKRRTKRVVLLGVVLSIVLVAAWLDIALDAGLVQVDGLKPVTHFFSN